jgi:uncharacterized protein
MPTVIVFFVILLLVALGGLYFAMMIVYPKTWKVEASFQKQVEEGKLIEEEFNALPKQELSIHSPYGYNLYGIYIPVEGSKKTVIIAHGITVTLYNSVKYLNLFRKRGFNVFLYEHRNHGRSGKNNTTYGYYEKDDLKAVVDIAMQKSGSGSFIGTMGESLGAAIALQHCAIDPRVSFVVADCSYSDLTDLLKYHVRLDYHLPPFPFLYIADFFCWLLTGITFTKVSPIRDIVAVETPIFWIHGQDDTYIPPRMSIEMYQAKKKGIKKLYLAPQAGHADAFWNNQVEYDHQVGDFLTEIDQKASETQ